VLERLDAALADADAALAGSWPGDPGTRQPVHTLYVPADRTGPDIVAATGTSALAVLDAHAPDAAALGRAVGLPEDAVAAVLPRVRAKLEREPVEDLRVDLEDGYGVRPDAEEDEHASAAGALLAAIAAGPGAPFSFGVRIKSFEAPTRRRGVRSFDLVVGALVAAGAVPDGFVVTLPKVTSVEQVSAMVTVCAEIEAAYDLPAGSLRFEVQVETPQVILGADGAATVARIVHAAQGRCSGLHYGTYDYSAALGIAAAYQSLEHPAADHAKAVMQLAAAQTGVRVCDGSTNVLPVGTRSAVHAAWGLHARWCAAHSNAASTRAGTCTPVSCRPATSRPTRSTTTGWGRPATACAPTRRVSRAACSTSRLPPTRSPRSSCAGSTVARSTSPRCCTGRGWTSRPCTNSGAGRPRCCTGRGWTRRPRTSLGAGRRAASPP
jgi:hypothetical protein